MAKGTNCVIVYSVILLILFGVFCYLMTIVNPEPLKTSSLDDSLSEAEIKLDNFIFDDVLVPPVDTVLFGLEKADHETEKPPIKLPLSRAFGRNSSYSFNYTVRRVIPPISSPTTPYLNRTMQLINFTTEITTEVAVETTTEPYNEDNVEFETNETKNLSLKGHRRSIKDFEELYKEKFASVVLHVIDGSGRSRIGIKLGNKGKLKRRQSHNNRKLVAESPFSIGFQTNKSNFMTCKLANNAVLEVMPNDTVIIDEYDNGGENVDNPSAEINTEEIFSTNDTLSTTPLGITNTEVRDISKLQEPNNVSKATHYAEMFELKVLFDNETKSITNILNNEDLHMTTDNFIDSNNTASYIVQANETVHGILTTVDESATADLVTV